MESTGYVVQELPLPSNCTLYKKHTVGPWLVVFLPLFSYIPVIRRGKCVYAVN